MVNDLYSSIDFESNESIQGYAFNLIKNKPRKINRFYKNIIDELFENLQHTGKDKEVNTEQIDHAIDLIEDLVSLINYTYDEDKINSAYIDFNWYEDIKKPWAFDYFFIDRNEIAHIMKNYISQQWFMSQSFESTIIKIYLRVTINTYREEIINPTGKPPTSFKNFIFKVSKNFALFYIYPVCIVIGSFDYSIILGSLVSIGCLTPLILSKIHKKKRLKLLYELIDAKRYISSIAWSPNQFLKRILKLDEKIFIQDLIPFLICIQNRNKDIHISYFQPHEYSFPYYNTNEALKEARNVNKGADLGTYRGVS